MTAGSLPGTLQSAYDALLTRPLQDAASLKRLISDYLEELDKRFAEDAVFNLELAESIGKGCLALLEGFDEHPEDAQRAIQVACVYFVEDDDDDPDLDSVMGFDDDAMVFNHVAWSLGEGSLIVVI